MAFIHLNDRAILEVKGPDAKSFLHRLCTQNIDNLQPKQACFAALLTPQGKIITDFFVYSTQEDTYWLDCPQTQASTLQQRLTLYKLRSNLQIKPIEPEVYASLDFALPTQPIEQFKDPRSQNLGTRIFSHSKIENAEQNQTRYHEARIEHGIPQGDIDFAYGDTFPHEANMDLLHGLDFQKGCYVGQEVVARMQHRTNVRKRIVKVAWEPSQPTPQTGDEILTTNRLIGHLGTVVNNQGLALLRTDWAQEAQANNQPIFAGQTPITAVL